MFSYAVNAIAFGDISSQYICSHDTLQCWYNAVDFLQKSSLKTPHSLPVRARYGVSFVNFNSDLYSPAVIKATDCIDLVLEYPGLIKRWINSLWPSGAIWRHRSQSTIAQVMACCLMAPSHYLNQCWLIINEVLQLSHKGNFTGNAHNIRDWYDFQNS